jgi:hypothetical protein
MAFGAFGAGFYSAFPALFARAVRIERTAAALNRARVRAYLPDFGAQCGGAFGGAGGAFGGVF